MDWGMRNRLDQVMPGGKCFFMPMDHGYFLGPTTGLERPGETLEPLLPYVAAIFCTRGVLRSAIDPKNSKPIVLRVSGCSSMVGKDLANEEITTSVEEVIRLNASAVGISVFIGSAYEKETLKNLSDLVNKCERYGIPVYGHPLTLARLPEPARDGRPLEAGDVLDLGAAPDGTRPWKPTAHHPPAPHRAHPVSSQDPLGPALAGPRGSSGCSAAGAAAWGGVRSQEGRRSSARGGSSGAAQQGCFCRM